MNAILTRFVNSSIVKKQVMAITGLLLVGFLVSHLAGNTLIILSPKGFNLYAHALTSNPLIYVAEVILLGLFLSHMGLAFRTTVENKRARGTPYAMKVPTGKGATFASSTMIYTGMLLLVFLVLHIWHLKFGTLYTISYDGLTVRDLHKTVVEYFQKPVNVGFYVLSMFGLGLHLSHGFWSAFQSLGLYHPKYTPCSKSLAVGLAIILGLGFSILPVYCFLKGGAM